MATGMASDIIFVIHSIDGDIGAYLKVFFITRVIYNINKEG
jgi:hypothetical protein